MNIANENFATLVIIRLYLRLEINYYGLAILSTFSEKRDNQPTCLFT